MAHAHVIVTFHGVLPQRVAQPGQLPLGQLSRQQPRLVGADGLRPHLSLPQQQRLRRCPPGVPQQRPQVLALQPPVLQPHQQRRHRQQPSRGKGAAQVAGPLAHGLLRAVAAFDGHAAGAYGLQQGGGRVSAEDERRVGRALLHDLQQHVLVALVQLAAVPQDIHLARRLVGADVYVLSQGADGLHRQFPVLRVLHGDDIRVYALQHLAAVAAAQAGLVRPLAHVCRGDEQRGGGQVALPRHDHRVAEPSLTGGAAHGAGQYAVFRRKLHHVPHLAYYFNIIV